MATFYGDQAAAARDASVKLIPTDYDKKTPQPDGSQNDLLNNELGRNIRNTVNALPGAAGVPGAVGAGGGLVAKAFGVAAPAAPFAAPAGLAAAVGAGRASEAAPPAQSPAPSSVGYNYLTAGEMGPPSSAAPAAPAAPSSGLPAMNGQVSRVGNSYSGTNVGGNITINGQEPGGGFVGSANTPTAGGAQAGGQSLVARALGGAAPAAPQVPWSGVIGSDPAAGNAQRERSDLMSSLTTVLPGAKGITAAQRNGLISLMSNERQDATSRANNEATNQAHQQMAAMGNDAAMQRSLVDAMMRQEEAKSRNYGQGIANRAAEQSAQMRTNIMNESDPTKRRSLVETMLAMEGKLPQNDWGVQVTPTTKNNDGTTSMGSVIRYNKSDGRVEQVPMQGHGLPAGMTRQVGTLGGKPVYEDASGKRFVMG